MLELCDDEIVRIFGNGATESVHIGQALMGCGASVDDRVDASSPTSTLARKTPLG